MTVNMDDSDGMVNWGDSSPWRPRELSDDTRVLLEQCIQDHVTRHCLTPALGGFRGDFHVRDKLILPVGSTVVKGSDSMVLAYWGNDYSNGKWYPQFPAPGTVVVAVVGNSTVVGVVEHLKNTIVGPADVRVNVTCVVDHDPGDVVEPGGVYQVVTDGSAIFVELPQLPGWC